MDGGRWSLGLGWSGVACSFLITGRRWGAARWLGAFAAALLAGGAFARWHVALWQAVRAALRRAGLYGERAFFKAAIAVGLVLALVLVARLVRPRIDARAQFPLAALCAAIAYLLAQTAFLDGLLPAAWTRPPGRYAVEGAFLAATALGLVHAARAGTPMS